jgi:hypothetical protein
MGLGSGIRKKPISDPESRIRIQDPDPGTGSRIQIRNIEIITDLDPGGLITLVLIWIRNIKIFYWYL